jgi:polyisoprenoid-binding protein YceI
MTVTAASIVLPSAGRYRIDPARTTIAVKVRHLFGLGTVSATFALREAEVAVGESATATTVHAVVDAASFASGNSKRDGDIRSPKFLDADAHPDITVEIRSAQLSEESWTRPAPSRRTG